MDSRKQYFSELLTSIPFGWWVFGIVALDVLSFHVRFIAALQIPVFILLALTFFLIALRNLHWGVLLLFAELFVGSKGYLFAIEVGGFPLSIRLALFILLMLATGIHMLRKKRIAFFHWSLWEPYTIVCLAIVVASVIGVLRGNGLSTVFLDANGYLFFGAIVAVVQSTTSKKQMQQILAVLCAATTALALKTLFLLFLFSHIELMPFTVMGIYQWVRDTGVGEVTRFPNGFARVFIQSQIYMLITLFFLMPWFAIPKKVALRKESRVVRGVFVLIILCTSVIILNYSRSFWAATIATLGLFTLWLLVKERMAFRALLKNAGALLATVVASYVLILAVINVPLPGFTPIGDLFSQRASGLDSEAAASTRWNLLGPLSAAVLENPVLGSGLGATITYISDDPRVREQSPDGTYTTYAFEWGYLDLLYKFGLLGIIALGYLIVTVAKRLYIQSAKNQPERLQAIGALAALVALLGTHMFTPYLNHPLGIGWILIVSILAAKPYANTHSQ